MYRSLSPDVVRGRRVLVRADLNVPLDDTGAISDDGRIRALLPTLAFLREADAQPIVLAHLGRPKGQVDPKLSLKPVSVRLAELAEQPVIQAETVVGPDVSAAVERLVPGEILLLENVRFDPRETSKDPQDRLELAQQWAQLGELFISDGFGVLHREQASVTELATLLPAYPGKLVQSELLAFSEVLTEPKRPYTVILGGSKVSDKLGVFEFLLNKVDRFLVGGGMCFTFLVAQGYSVGTSLLEVDRIAEVRELLGRAEAAGVEILLPPDVVVAPRFAADAPATVVSVTDIPPDHMGLDIGPESVATFSQAIESSNTIVWNGPMGVFEFEAFAQGTRTLAQTLAAQREAFTVVGGGDSAAAIRTFEIPEADFSHISTGGGASLELLEGKTLPGLAVLQTTGDQ